MYPCAPISSASHSKPKPEMITTGMSLVSGVARSFCSSSRPFITGICKSRSTSSGGFSRIRSSASFPLPASPTW